MSAPSKVTRRFESSWSGAVRTLGAVGSHISSLEVSTCPVESVDEEVCSAGTTSRVFCKEMLDVFFGEGVLRWPPLETCLEFLPWEHKYLQTKLLSILFMLDSPPHPSQTFVLMCSEHPIFGAMSWCISTHRARTLAGFIQSQYAAYIKHLARFCRHAERVAKIFRCAHRRLVNRSIKLSRQKVIGCFDWDSVGNKHTKQLSKRKHSRLAML